jgi:hypothetical protein
VNPDLVNLQDIGRARLVLRGQRIILECELAALYGVTTKRLNEAVRRDRAFKVAIRDLEGWARQLPKTQQKVVMQMLDGVLAQSSR